MSLLTNSKCFPCVVVDLPVKKVISPSDIIIKGCDYFGLTKKQLIEKNRKRELVNARHMIIHLLCKNTIYKLSYIAKLMGFADHSTIIHSRDKARDLIEVDTAYRNEYEELRRFILG